MLKQNYWCRMEVIQIRTGNSIMIELLSSLIYSTWSNDEADPITWSGRYGCQWDLII